MKRWNVESKPSRTSWRDGGDNRLHLLQRMILTRARSSRAQALSGVDDNRSLFLFPLHSRIRRFAKALDKSSLFDAAVYLSITGGQRANLSKFVFRFVSGLPCAGNFPPAFQFSMQCWGSCPVSETVSTFIMPFVLSNVHKPPLIRHCFGDFPPFPGSCVILVFTPAAPGWIPPEQEAIRHDEIAQHNRIFPKKINNFRHNMDWASHLPECPSYPSKRLFRRVENVAFSLFFNCARAVRMTARRFRRFSRFSSLLSFSSAPLLTA